MKKTESRISRKEFLILLAGAAQVVALSKFISFTKKVEHLSLSTPEKVGDVYSNSVYGGKKA